MDKPYRIIADAHTLRTDGLKNIGQPELHVKLNSEEYSEEAESFLRYICDYIINSKVIIKHNETLMYGYWIVKFIADNNDRLEVYELERKMEDFVPGIVLTLKYWRDQHCICEIAESDFIPPHPNNMVAVSKGVLEGDLPVEGVRYPAPEHMSGWYLTTDKYDETEELNVVHMYHVTSAREDIAPFIALPEGFCFKLGDNNHVWFDEEVAQSVDS